MPVDGAGNYRMNPHAQNLPPMDNPKEEAAEGASAGHKPSIHIHSHAKGHTVHIFHKDGGHEKHEHPHGDASGIAQHIHDHLGGGQGAPEFESSSEGDSANIAAKHFGR